MTDDTATTIAAAFRGTLRGWLNDATLKKIDRENARRRKAGDTQSCATHDFCDANMAMLPSFTSVVGREPDLDSDADAALWNRAWEIALSYGFSRA